MLSQITLQVGEKLTWHMVWTISTNRISLWSQSGPLVRSNFHLILFCSVRIQLRMHNPLLDIVINCCGLTQWETTKMWPVSRESKCGEQAKNTHIQTQTQLTKDSWPIKGSKKTWLSMSLCAQQDFKDEDTFYVGIWLTFLTYFYTCATVVAIQVTKLLKNTPFFSFLKMSIWSWKKKCISRKGMC